MQIEKVLNNNVAQALDNNVEYIVMGKGLGFQKKVGDLVDKEKNLKRTFVLENTEAVRGMVSCLLSIYLMVKCKSFELFLLLLRLSCNQV